MNRKKKAFKQLSWLLIKACLYVMGVIAACAAGYVVLHIIIVSIMITITDVSDIVLGYWDKKLVWGNALKSHFLFPHYLWLTPIIGVMTCIVTFFGIVVQLFTRDDRQNVINRKAEVVE